ncbi:MAG: flagellar assembly protein FliW [Gemmatimonadota bacterium]
MIVASDLLGPLEVEPSEIFRFPGGLFGFPDSRDFLLLPAELDGLYWLQSTEHSPLAFVMVDPFRFFEEYAVDLPDSELRDLGNPDRSELLVLAIVTLPRTQEDGPTANLQGPVAINLASHLGKQIPIADTDYELRAPFRFPAE